MPPAANRLTIIALTAIAMLAFAANSLLCRAALKSTAIDPASFTLIRLMSGALMLWLILRLRSGAAGVSQSSLPTRADQQGDWLSAGALFAYAISFSFAYLSLTAATGALLLFGAVQAAMIGVGLIRGERLAGRRLVGFLLAVGGLVALLLPGLSAPPLTGALLMVSAGIAWAVYSLRGKGAADPTAVTAGNFLRTVPLALAALVAVAATALGLAEPRVDAGGALLALLSGALASGVGYAIWYAALRGLHAIEAATVQLSVPVLAAVGGVLFLGESLTLRLVLCATAILGGVGLVILRRPARS